MPEGSAGSEGPNLPFRKTAARDWFEVLMYGLALLMFLKGFVFQNFQIPTKSMENSLLIGDHLMANKFMFGHTQWDWERKLFPFREVRRGDVLVFKYPNDVRQDYIKRCIGLSGERIQLKDDLVYVNGVPIQEPYTYYKEAGAGEDRDPQNKNRPLGYDEMEPGFDGHHYDSSYLDEVVRDPNNRDLVNFVTVTTDDLLDRTRQTFSATAQGNKAIEREFWSKLVRQGNATIPPGFYFMMGDNRNNSQDSRFWGLVPEAYVEGRAYVVWWSYGEDENSHQLKGFDLIWSYLRVPLRFLTHTRWNQCMRLIK